MTAAGSILAWTVIVCLIQGLPTAPVDQNASGLWISRASYGGGGGGGGAAVCRGRGSVGHLCLRLTGGGTSRTSRGGGGAEGSGGGGGGMNAGGNYWGTGGSRRGDRRGGTRMGLGPAQGRGDRKNGARGNKARVAPLGFVSGGVLKGKGRHKRPGGGSQAPQKNKRNQNVVADQRVAARGKRKEGGDKVPAPPVAKAKEQDSAKARADGDDGLLGITEDVRRHVWPDGALKGDEELEARLRHATVERRTNDDDKIGALLMQNLDALVEGVNVDALVRGSMARWDGDHDVDDNHDDGVVRGEVEAFEERLRAIAGLEPGEAGSDRGIGGLSVGSMDGERVDDDGRGMESDELDQASLDEEDDDLSSAYSNGKRSRYNLPVEASSQDSKDSDAESEEMKRESYEEGENDSTIAKLDAEEEEMLRGEVANVASLATLPSDMADLLPYDEMDESVEQGLSSYEVPPGGEEELARWREGKSTRAVAPRVRNRDRVEPTFVKDPAALELVDEEDTAPVISATFRDQLLAPAQPPPKLKENALAFRARVGMSKDECRHFRSSVKSALFEQTWGCSPNTSFGYLEDYVNPRYRWPMKLGKRYDAGLWVREKRDWCFGAELAWGDSEALSRQNTI